MHEMGFEPMNSKRRELKSRAVIWIILFGATICGVIHIKIIDHFATHALIFLLVPFYHF